MAERVGNVDPCAMHQADPIKKIATENSARAIDSEIVWSGFPKRQGPRVTTVRGGTAYCLWKPGAEKFTPLVDMAFVWLSPVLITEIAGASQETSEYDAPIGAVRLNQANVEYDWSWKSTIEFVAIALPRDRLRSLVREEFGSDSIDLIASHHHAVDPKALWLAQMLKEELTGPNTPSELYIDSIITLFGLHLFKNYSTSSKSTRRAYGGLSPARVRKVQDYLRANIARVTVDQLAAVCGLSVGHFTYAFTETFRQSPHKYILGLRLATAERMLVETELKISEVAYLTGFSSQSHLTTAMRRHKHITPAKLRQQK